MIEFEGFIEFLRDVGDDMNGVSVREYSGRFMYGKICPGVVVPSATTFAQFIFEASFQIYERGDENILKVMETAMFNIRQDEMGRDFVFYFPSITK